MTTTAPSKADGASIELPERTSNRAEATKLVDDAIGETRVAVLTVDASQMVLSAPSFLDQLVKDVLITRRVPELVVVSATERAGRLLTAAAIRRQVEALIRFENTRS